MEKGKYRFSPQRQAVLEAVTELNTHVVAQQIHQKVNESHPEISLSTVYRNLNQLVEMGKLSTLKDKGLILYEANLSDHDHFFCSECHTWYDVDVLTDGVIASFARGKSFRIDTINLELSGTCEKCLTA